MVMKKKANEEEIDNTKKKKIVKLDDEAHTTASASKRQAAKTGEVDDEHHTDYEDYEQDMLPPVSELVVRTPRQLQLVRFADTHHERSRVPTLTDTCLRKLYMLASQIGYLGNVPYDVIEAVLTTMAWPDLYRVDFLNPSLRLDLNGAWHDMCKREYPKENDARQPTDGTSWRRVFQDRKMAVLERLRVKIGLIDSERY